MQREPERQDQHIELTVAQEQVAHSIINSLNAAQGTRKFIVLEGLPGVGKTTLLESIEESVVLHGGR
ncbi:MAG: hypothetical protein NTY06_03405, partial [Candidatus Gottesmanbacteria bacterium]|nr:hypothetical protein [Candidatus Gottesmanbacteria bacterium]